MSDKPSNDSSPPGFVVDIPRRIPGHAFVPPPEPADPVAEAMEVLATMMGGATVNDSPKARAWELLCACAHRAPVDETDVKRALVLADKFEELWAERDALRAMNAAEIDVVRRP